MATNTKTKKPKAGSRWSGRELTFLERNYTKLTSKEIAARLGRPVGGVKWQIHQLGLVPELNNPSPIFQTYTNRDDIYPRALDPVDTTKRPWWKFW